MDHSCSVSRRTLSLILCFTVLIGFVLPVSVFAEENSPQTTVRVGFYECPFNIKDGTGQLYVNNSDTGIDRSDLSTLVGKRIGVNAGNIQADLFNEWAQKNGVNVDTIPCYSDYAMLEMLENGELDAVVAVDSYAFDNTAPMVRIGESDFYFAVNINRPDLKAQLDEAMGYFKVF